MANSGHDHTAASDGVVEYQRVNGKQLHQTGKKVGVDEQGAPLSLVGPPQHYVDHAGRPTTVIEYEGRADAHVYVGEDQPVYWEREAKKRSLVERAQRLSTATDWKSAGEQLRALSDEWKRIGGIDKTLETQLWRDFSTARQHFYDARQRHFEKREADWARNRSTKERIVSQAENLANSSDLRTAGDSMRKLSDEWKSTGPCEKADNDRLWTRFNAARTKLNDRKKQDFEKRKAERRQRAFEYVARLEQQLRNVESAIYRAEDSYSRALSARSPSFNNPNWQRIAQSQNARRDSARARLASLQSRKAEIITKLMSARSQANSL